MAAITASNNGGVSIPFKRDRLSEQGGVSPIYPAFEYVSIPFKRDRLSELDKALVNGERNSKVFQFPSNGIGFPNELGEEVLFDSIYQRFQFPSNGIGFPNLTINATPAPKNTNVSIPFKRDRLSEPITIKVVEKDVKCFNSLQTG